METIFTCNKGKISDIFKNLKNSIASGRPCSLVYIKKYDELRLTKREARAIKNGLEVTIPGSGNDKRGSGCHD
jgi:hypothetical protein